MARSTQVMASSDRYQLDRRQHGGAPGAEENEDELERFRAWMVGEVGAGRRLAALAAASVLVALLGLTWTVRPPLPPFHPPHSFTAPLPMISASTLAALLALVIWALVVLLEFWFLAAAAAAGAERRPTAADLRLWRALHSRQNQTEPSPRQRRPRAAPAPDLSWIYNTSRRRACDFAAESGAGGGAAANAVAAVETESPSLPAALVEPAAPAAAAVGARVVGVRLFGRFELVNATRLRPRLQSTRELIAYLATEPAGASRERVLEALWPRERQARRAQRFWHSATEARKLLGDGFRRDGDRYQLDRNHLSVDLDGLQRLATRAAAATGRAEQRQLVEEALALYRDRPLAEFDAPWADAHARRLQATHASLLERAGRLRLQAGEPAAALEAAELGLGCDRLNERFAQIAMEAEAALGRRDALIDRYQRWSRLLDSELGLEPARETRLLYRRLLSQDSDDGSEQ